jgi:hypothetical protein
LQDGQKKPRFNPYVSSGILAYELRRNWTCVHDAAEFEVTVNTNDLGLRGRPVPQPKPPGVYRVAVLGDSFVFGFGVEDEEALPAQIDAILSNRYERIEVLNAGVPGWATDQYSLFLRRRHKEIEADLILLGLSDNEVSDLMWHRLTLDRERLPLRIQSTRRMIDHRGRMRYVNDHRFSLPSFAFPGQTWLQDHSQLYHWLRFRLTRAWVALAMKAQSQAWDSHSAKGPLEPMRSLAPEQIQEGLETSPSFRLRYHRYLLDSIERFCRAKGIGLRIVQLAGKHPARSGPVRDALREDCAARRHRCLDLYRRLPEKRVEDLYFRVDGHWNAAGHRWAAGVIVHWLEGDARLDLAGGLTPQ